MFTWGMVYKKISEFGEAPSIPKARRSVRKIQRKRVVESKDSPCAFELLAAVAGKLWEESEDSASGSAAAEVKSKIQDKNEKELPRNDIAFKSESFDRCSYAESVFAPEISSKEHNLLVNCKGLLESDVNTLKNVDCDIPNNASKGISHTSIGEYGSEVLSRDEKYKDQSGICVNTNSLVASESSVKLPLYRKSTPRALVQKHWDTVKVGIRDDDENSIACNEYSTKIRPFRPQSCLVHRRMRKILTSRYGKAAAKRKAYNLSTFGKGTKAFYGYRKSVYARYQQAPIKKRKFFDHRFSAEYDCGDNSCNFISNVLGEVDGTKNNSKPKERHVTLSIKSFKVPEIYLEVPESATVGSLKRTVLEEVTPILLGGIQIGVFFEGRKLRNDNRTLQQAGISQYSNLDFSLEPSLSCMNCTNPKGSPVSFTCDADHNTPRSLASPLIDPSEISNGMVEPQTVIKSGDIDSKEPDDMPNEGDDFETMALVPVIEAHKPGKCTEVSQRRTRRPFSVAEVEALVEAVENMGTGRWRDVKMRAFENAGHRTYVDLKDKWKTLVHTASISPQQRRGEPVPHELLDRVLAAHSYWSQHPSKQHKKALAIE